MSFSQVELIADSLLDRDIHFGTWFEGDSLAEEVVIDLVLNIVKVFEILLIGAAQSHFELNLWVIDLEDKDTLATCTNKSQVWCLKAVVDLTNGRVVGA